MWSINEFCELLDHELRELEPLSDLYGVRLDESWGVKQFCGMQTLKSVDFLVTLKGSHVFLEFSDIGSQIDSTLAKIEVLDNAKDLPKGLKRNLAKSLKVSIGREARDKYKDTCTLFTHVSEKLTDTPSLAKGCKFIVVYAPLRDNFSASTTEIVKFIDHMQNSLATMIPDDMFHRVEIITLDVFKSRYEAKVFQS